ncbi:hypothetical protein [Adhaeretor mobilis]|uniref:Uncharacterized protein n=1 Tax=Adhaeretor mobilis TaxID=1930276 RepID=A0A517N271_9BACT|nr:hypothetical protein [Adhaeretor mobilis]QDT01234.1 hypothetical protein HG15A2_45760 [Adhaeretor mobilis]
MADDLSDDDDLELELEPVDPAIVAHEKQRAEQRIKRAGQTVAIDNVYEEDEEIGLDFETDWIKQFRFSTRHLLILTAVLAIVLTLHRQVGGCNLLFWGFLTVVAAGWYFVLRQERQLIARRQAKRAELEALFAQDEDAFEDTGSFARDLEAMRAESMDAERPRFQWQFSMQQLLMAMTAAALMLGFSRLFGRDTMGILLGFTALAGLVVYATGYEAPRIVVLGWWLLLVMYLMLGLVMMFVPEGA